MLRTGENPSADCTQAACARHRHRAAGPAHGTSQEAMGKHDLSTTLWQWLPQKCKAKPSFRGGLQREIVGIFILLHCYQNDSGVLIFHLCREKSDSLHH